MFCFVFRKMPSYRNPLCKTSRTNSCKACGCLCFGVLSFTCLTNLATFLRTNPGRFCRKNVRSALLSANLRCFASFSRARIIVNLLRAGCSSSSCLISFSNFLCSTDTGVTRSAGAVPFGSFVSCVCPNPPIRPYFVVFAVLVSLLSSHLKSSSVQCVLLVLLARSRVAVTDLF